MCFLDLPLEERWREEDDETCSEPRAPARLADEEARRVRPGPAASSVWR